MFQSFAKITGGLILEKTFEDTRDSPTDTLSYLFTNVNWGAIDAGRRSVVGVAVRFGANNGRINAVEIDPNGTVEVFTESVQLQQNDGGNSSAAAVFIADTSAFSATEDLRVGVSGIATAVRMACAVYRIIGKKDQSAFDTHQNGNLNANFNLDIPPGGVGIAAQFNNGTGNSWTGLTLDANVPTEGNEGSFASSPVLPAGDPVFNVTTTPAGNASTASLAAATYAPG